jgi:hypothetical protein
MANTKFVAAIISTIISSIVIVGTWVIVIRSIASLRHERTKTAVGGARRLRRVLVMGLLITDSLVA